jgi:hypothetical protein
MQDAGGGSLSTYYRITDSTDIVVPDTEASANVIGSSFSMYIPTSGHITFGAVAAQFDTYNANGYSRPCLGFKISGTIYPLVRAYGYSNTPGSSPMIPSYVYFPNPLLAFILNNQTQGATGLGQKADSCPIEYMISAKSLPTGTQTVELVIFKWYSTGSITLKGTVVTTDIIIDVVDLSGV